MGLQRTVHGQVITDRARELASKQLAGLVTASESQ